MVAQSSFAASRTAGVSEELLFGVIPQQTVMKKTCAAGAPVHQVGLQTVSCIHDRNL
jgi:hypothetical protein